MPRKPGSTLGKKSTKFNEVQKKEISDWLRKGIRTKLGHI